MVMLVCHESGLPSKLSPADSDMVRAATVHAVWLHALRLSTGSNLHAQQTPCLLAGCHNDFQGKGPTVLTAVLGTEASLSTVLFSDSSARHQHKHVHVHAYNWPAGCTCVSSASSS